MPRPMTYMNFAQEADLADYGCYNPAEAVSTNAGNNLGGASPVYMETNKSSRVASKDP